MHDLVTDDDWYVAFCMGGFGPAGASAVRPLMQAIQKSSSEHGWTAVQALDRIGPAAREAIPLLESLQNSDDFFLRGSVPLVLKAIKGED